MFYLFIFLVLTIPFLLFFIIHNLITKEFNKWNMAMSVYVIIGVSAIIWYFTPIGMTVPEYGDVEITIDHSIWCHGEIEYDEPKVIAFDIEDNAQKKAFVDLLNSMKIRRKLNARGPLRTYHGDEYADICVHFKDDHGLWQMPSLMLNITGKHRSYLHNSYTFIRNYAITNPEALIAFLQKEYDDRGYAIDN